MGFTAKQLVGGYRWISVGNGGITTVSGATVRDCCGDRIHVGTKRDRRTDRMAKKGRKREIDKQRKFISACLVFIPMNPQMICHIR